MLERRLWVEGGRARVMGKVVEEEAEVKVENPLRLCERVAPLI